MDTRRWALPWVLGSALALGACGGDDDRWDWECDPHVVGSRLSAAEAFAAIRDRRFQPDGDNACGESDSIEFDDLGNAQAYARDGRPDGDPLSAVHVLEALAGGYRERDGDIYRLEVYEATVNGATTLQLVESENGRIDAVYRHP